MKPEEVGKRVKAKYPQYQNISDEEVGKLTIAKYPQYGEQQVKPQNKALNLASRVLSAPSDILGGMMKGGREYMTGDYQAPNLGKIGDLELGKLLHPSLVGGVRGLKDRTPVIDELPQTLGINPESGAGMAVGLAGEIATPDLLDVVKFGKVASKITSKMGKGVTETGEKLVVRGLKPSPSQQRKFLQETGESLSDFMSKNKITSNFVEKSSEKLDELQSAFDEIAIKSNKMVSNEDLYKSFAKRIKDFESNIIPSMQGKSEDIKSVFNNLINKYLPNLAGDIKSGRKLGKASFNVGDLTKERKVIDKALKENQYQLPIEQASYLRSVRDALQETIQEATKGLTYKGKNLKELGRELSKFYKFQDIAEKQAGLGKGTLMPGLTDLLAMGTGSLYGQDPMDRLKNALLFGLSRRAVSNPKVIGGTSKVMQKTGEVIGGNKVTKSLEALMRVAKEMGIDFSRQ